MFSRKSVRETRCSVRDSHKKSRDDDFHDRSGGGHPDHHKHHGVSHK